MTTYNTGNPIGSTDPKDLYDNAQNLDVLVNSATEVSHADRKGVQRKTWRGIEEQFDQDQSDRADEFAQFMADSAYQELGDYGAGIVITRYNQVFRKDGEWYRPAAALDLPYTTTGVWGDESIDFVGVGDAVLRQDLAAPGGAALVGADDGASGSLWTTVAGFIAFILSSLGASVIGFIQAGTGAVARTAQDKMREVVSRADFFSDAQFDAAKGVKPSIAGNGDFDAKVTLPGTSLQRNLSDVLADLDRSDERPGILTNNPSATAKNITLIGDSISHGAFALNTFLHGWARILNRMVNAKVSANSYGFTNLLSLGSGGTQTFEIHSVSFGGPSWGAPAADSAQAQASPAGAPMRAGGVGSTITITLPFFQNRGEIHYIKQPGGGTFTITVNGALAHTVDTNGATIEWASQGFNMADAGYGSVTIVVAQTLAGTVDIVGPGYLSSAIEPVFNNFAVSGRRLRNTGQAVIQSLMSQSSTFIMALGHNDQGDADANETYFGEFVQRIDWLIQYANQYNVKMVVPDFCWTAASTSRARDQLRRLALETGGVYVDLPSMIFSGGQTPSTSYLINTLKMWVDGSHPNRYGMKWIAETVSKAMGLSCTSKTDAILFHDFWMPLSLKAATSIENALPANVTTVSAYKRNGDNVLVKLFVEAAPGGAFPTGAHSLTDSFNPKSELNLAQSGNGLGVIRPDTGAIVSTFTIDSIGALTLTVYSSFINDQAFAFTWPAETVRNI